MPRRLTCRKARKAAWWMRCAGCGASNRWRCCNWTRRTSCGIVWCSTLSTPTRPTPHRVPAASKSPRRGAGAPPPRLPARRRLRPSTLAKRPRDPPAAPDGNTGALARSPVPRQQQARTPGRVLPDPKLRHVLPRLAIGMSWSSLLRRTSNKRRIKPETREHWWSRMQADGTAGSLGIAAIFCLLAALIFTLREEAPGYRIHDWVGQDIYSRVEFVYHDAQV